MNKKNEFHRKMVIQNQMLNYAEDLVKDRRDKLRFGRVKSLREKTNIKIPIRQRDIIVEGKIEADIDYFKSTMAMRKGGIDFVSLRAQMVKNEEMIRKNKEK